MSSLLPSECQKYSTRCGRLPTNREPNTTSALSSTQRLEQELELLRVVLEVGVLHHHVLAAWHGANPVRSAAPLPWLTGCRITFTRARRSAAEDLAALVGRAVVDHDHLTHAGLARARCRSPTRPSLPRCSTGSPRSGSPRGTVVIWASTPTSAIRDEWPSRSHGERAGTVRRRAPTALHRRLCNRTVARAVPGPTGATPPDRPRCGCQLAAGGRLLLGTRQRERVLLRLRRLVSAVAVHPSLARARIVTRHRGSRGRTASGPSPGATVRPMPVAAPATTGTTPPGSRRTGREAAIAVHARRSADRADGARAPPSPRSGSGRCGAPSASITVTIGAIAGSVRLASVCGTHRRHVGRLEQVVGVQDHPDLRTTLDGEVDAAVEVARHTQRRRIALEPDRGSPMASTTALALSSGESSTTTHHHDSSVWATTLSSASRRYAGFE